MTQKINNNKLTNDDIITGLRGLIKDFPINKIIRSIIADRLEKLTKENFELEKNIINLIIEKDNMHNNCRNIFYIPEIVDKIIYFLIYRNKKDPNIKNLIFNEDTDEILHVSYINKYLLKFMYVNKLWYNVIYKYIWRNMNYQDLVNIYKCENNIIEKYSDKIRILSLRKINNINNTNIDKIICKFNKLILLDIDFKHNKTYNINKFYKLFEYGMIEYLCIKRCIIRDPVLSYISSFCMKLKYLSLTECENITDESISNVALNCPQLEFLRLYNVNITDHSIKMIAIYTSIEIISLFGCNITNNSIFYLIKYSKIISINANRTNINNKVLDILYKSQTLKLIGIKNNVIDNYPIIYDLVFKKGIEFILDDKQKENYNKWFNKNIKRKSFST